jgi:hypothetical protein
VKSLGYSYRTQETEGSMIVKLCIIIVRIYNYELHGLCKGVKGSLIVVWEGGRGPNLLWLERRLPTLLGSVCSPSIDNWCRCKCGD